MARRPFKARKSKLDAFVDIVGVEPDAVVAAKARVSTETVRTFRVRRGVPASWRGETETPKKPAGADQSVARSKVQKRAFRGRRSRLDPYAHLLGSHPDAEVAAMAGVTVENVRSFRRRRGIKANWRNAVVSLDHLSTPPLRGDRPRIAAFSHKEDTQRWAYRVTARVGVEDKDFVVFGESLSDAARTAERRIAERIPRARVLEIATLAEAL